ncbi:MAG TPA: hypothetical protein VF788_05980, partial [Pseudonocardiaceae bacterium]
RTARENGRPGQGAQQRHRAATDRRFTTEGAAVALVVRAATSSRTSHRPSAATAGPRSRYRST